MKIEESWKPTVQGIEPRTPCLRHQCSTTVLWRLNSNQSSQSYICTASFSIFTSFVFEQIWQLLTNCYPLCILIALIWVPIMYRVRMSFCQRVGGAKWEELPATVHCAWTATFTSWFPLFNMTRNNKHLSMKRGEVLALHIVCNW